MSERCPVAATARRSCLPPPLSSPSSAVSSVQQRHVGSESKRLWASECAVTFGKGRRRRGTIIEQSSVRIRLESTLT